MSSNKRLTTVCMLVDSNGKKIKDTTIGIVQQRTLNSLSPKQQYKKIEEKVLQNLRALYNQLKFVAKMPAGCNSFRISSNLLPMFDHPEFSNLYDTALLCKIDKGLAMCKKVIDLNNIRVGTHPDKFTVINSLTESVNIKSIRTLEYHKYFLERLTSVSDGGYMNLHLNGTGTDVCPQLLDRPDLLAWLTLENDDVIERGNTPNTLRICQKYGIRMVFDIHHHFCLTRDLLSVTSDTFKAIMGTWGSSQPLLHLSQSFDMTGDTPKKLSKHSDYITDSKLINYVDNLFSVHNITLDVEAKAKNLAVTGLLSKLKNI